MLLFLFAGGFVLQERCLLLGVFLFFVCSGIVVVAVTFFLLLGGSFLLGVCFAVCVCLLVCWERFLLGAFCVCWKRCFTGTFFVCWQRFCWDFVLLGGCLAYFVLGGLLARMLFCWDLFLLGKSAGLDGTGMRSCRDGS